MNYLFADASQNDTYMQIGSNTAFIEEIFETTKTLGAKVSVLCDEMLKKQKLSIEQIDLFAVCTGPGSLTGLRVAMAFFRTLSMASNKPIIGISLFQWAAQTLLNMGVRGKAALYSPTLIDKAFMVKANLSNEMALEPPVLCDRSPLTEPNAYGVRYEAEGIKPITPSGKAIHELILKNEGRRADFNEALRVLPLYIIGSQAERRLKEAL